MPPSRRRPATGTDTVAITTKPATTLITPEVTRNAKRSRRGYARAVMEVRKNPQVAVTLAIPAVVTLAAVAQAYIVARGDVDVIRVLLAYVDIPRAVLALIIFWLPIVAAIAVPFSWLYWLGGLEQPSASLKTLPFPVLPLALTIMALVVSPVVLILAVIGYSLLPLVIALVGPWFKKRSRKRSESEQPVTDRDGQPQGNQRLRQIAPVLLGLVITMLFLLEIDRPWVAREVIAVASDPAFEPERIETAYVLGTSGSSLVILWDQDRSVWVIPEEWIPYRQPCAERGLLGGLTLWQQYWLIFEPGLAACGDALEAAKEYTTPNAPSPGPTSQPTQPSESPVAAPTSSD